VVVVPDLLIRNVDEETVRQIDARAEVLGLSRSEFLRREVHRVAQVSVRPATRADFEWVSEMLVDLVDDALMARAWA
jgi:hypothetical protein